MLIEAKKLPGYKLESLDGEIGQLKEFYFDDRHWAVRYLIADTCLPVSHPQVLISPYALVAVNKEKQNIATGAENDLQQVTGIARHMVRRWGMSGKLVPISFVAPQDEGLPPAFQHQPNSETTSELIDAEVRAIVDESHREAERLLSTNRDKLDGLAQALLKAESLDAKEVR